MKKTAFIIALMLFLPLVGWASWYSVNSPSNADLILGNWKPSNGRSVISMYKGVAANGEDASKYYGKIVWLSEPNDAAGKPRTDINNPDAKKRNTPMKGLVLVKAMSFDEVDGNLVLWEGGTIYDPNNGSEYSFAAEIDKKNESVLNGRGYIGVSLFGRTDTWTKLVKK